MDETPEKRSPKKIAVEVALLLLAVIGVAAFRFVPPVIFQQRVKASLEVVTKTQVDVKGASIATDMSSGYVEGISIHNPQGYTGVKFIEIPKLSFEIHPQSLRSKMVSFKHITLHSPVLHMETQGETSNLKQMIEIMLVPGGEPTPPVSIDSLRIENGKIEAVFEYSDGKPVISDFPVSHIDNLEGNAAEIGGQVAKALQKQMDDQVKAATEGFKADFAEKFKGFFNKN